jgi:uncharacterized membrane protein
MTFIGRLHPLLVHFPIALILLAAAAEIFAVVTVAARWHVVAIACLRAGAIGAVGAAGAGWLMARMPGVDPSATLEWHRWFGTATAATAVIAVLVTAAGERSSATRWIDWMAMLAAALCVAATGHLGGMLVWGADFLRP